MLSHTLCNYNKQLSHAPTRISWNASFLVKITFRFSPNAFSRDDGQKKSLENGLIHRRSRVLDRHPSEVSSSHGGLLSWWDGISFLTPRSLSFFMTRRKETWHEREERSFSLSLSSLETFLIRLRETIFCARQISKLTFSAISFSQTVRNGFG